MELTEEDYAILAHVVVDPDGWFAHVVKTFGEQKASEMLAAKADRWRPHYKAGMNKPGYKNRVERDADEAELYNPTAKQISMG